MRRRRRSSPGRRRGAADRCRSHGRSARDAALAALPLLAWSGVVVLVDSLGRRGPKLTLSVCMASDEREPTLLERMAGRLERSSTLRSTTGAWQATSGLIWFVAAILTAQVIAAAVDRGAA